jgi:AhpD family alkylhydroperoxidase
MTDFNIHTIESAPDGSKPILEQLEKQVGFVPNLAATMAESPSLLEAFTILRAIYGRGSFTPIEREAIAIAVSFDYNCAYCMAAHSTFAKMNGIQEDDLFAARGAYPPRTSAYF